MWTSTLQRALQTTRALGRRFESLKALDEIDAGVCDGLSYAQVAERMPEEFAARKADKLRYRYPRGESYEDVISRVEPVIIEMERQPTPVVIVAHQAILRTLYAYLTGRSRKECPHIEVPIHTVIELRPGSYGVAEQRYPLLPEQ